MSEDFLGTYEVPDLCTVHIKDEAGSHFVEIVLSDKYDGELTYWLDKSPYGDRVIFHGDSMAAKDCQFFAKFFEELHHWDHDRDGVFDGDAVHQAIDAAFHHWSVGPVSFKRPGGGVYTAFIMRFMPPAPDRHILFGYGELKPRFRTSHYLIAIPTIAIVIGLIQLQIWALPFMKYSVISAFAELGNRIGFIAAWMLLLFGLFLAKWFVPPRKSSPNQKSFSPHTYGFFNKAAVSEEQAFREGAENWTTGERARSCLVFGAIHMVNLWYPLATILPLSFGGAVFMYYYMKAYNATQFRRWAVLEASLVHRVYNRIALTIFVGFVVIATGALLWTSVTFFAALMLVRIGVMMIVNRSSISEVRLPAFRN